RLYSISAYDIPKLPTLPYFFARSLRDALPIFDHGIALAADQARVLQVAANALQRGAVGRILVELAGYQRHRVVQPQRVAHRLLHVGILVVELHLNEGIVASARRRRGAGDGELDRLRALLADLQRGDRQQTLAPRLQRDAEQQPRAALAVDDFDLAAAAVAADDEILVQRRPVRRAGAGIVGLDVEGQRFTERDTVTVDPCARLRRRGETGAR